MSLRFCHVRRSCFTAGIALVVLACHAYAEDKTPSFSQLSDPLDDKALARLIDDLGDPDWKKRDLATQVLMNRGPELYEPLRQAFHHADQYEVRHRIKQIAREIYVTKALGPSPAFLGIQHTGRAVGTLMDSRVPAGSTGILIMEVFSSTAAERAGLEPGDLVLSLNGKRARGKKTALSFTQWIGSQKPGASCQLGILRGGRGILLNKVDFRNFRPTALAKLPMRPLQHEDDPRILPGSAGFIITNDQRIGRDLGLKKGDLLLSLDGKTLPAKKAAEMFTKWIEGKLTKNDIATNKEPERGKKQNSAKRAIQKKLVPSAQFLRGGKYMEVSVMLGRRPTFLTNLQSRGRGVSSRETNDAYLAFETWWNDWFKPNGRTADRFDAESIWRLEP